LIFAWAGSYWLKYHKWPWNELREAIYRNYEQKIDEGEQKKDESQQIKKTEDQIKSDLFRQGTMNDLADRIAKLSPIKPVLGGKWHVTRFWFIDDRNIYIEYEDGHIMGRILVLVLGQEERPEYKVVAYFEPGENDWVLKTGEDKMAGRKLSLYEFDESRKLWIKRN
jgi:hypothetical protein